MSEPHCNRFVPSFSELKKVNEVDDRRFSARLREWQGNQSHKEAAAVLGLDYATYRKYISGKRTPCKLAMCEIEHRMSISPPDDGYWKKRGDQMVSILAKKSE